MLGGIGAYSPDFLSIVQLGVFWSAFSVNFLVRSIYINLNNIDMLLLRISCSYGVFRNNILNFKLVRLGVYMVKPCQEKMLISRCILPPKKIEPPPEKT